MTLHLLFVCTHNRCRSILAEAITNHLGQGRLTATSAGSSPVGEVHPLTLKYLSERGVSTEGLCSQGWDEVTEPAPDVVVTVCDRAAGEACPLWLGDAEKVHWGLSDPSSIDGDDEARRAAFMATIDELRGRIDTILKSTGAFASRRDLAKRMRELV